MADNKLLKTKSRRKKLLINPDFQVNFLKNILFLNIGVCGFFYLAHAYFFWQGRELGRSIQLPADHVFFKFLAEQQRSMNLISLATMCVVSALIVAFGLVYSHRIAGPIYRLQKYLKERNAGTEKGNLYFRQGDYFPELADSVNEFVGNNKKEKPKAKKAA